MLRKIKSEFTQWVWVPAVPSRERKKWIPFLVSSTSQVFIPILGPSLWPSKHTHTICTTARETVPALGPVKL